MTDDMRSALKEIAVAEESLNAARERAKAAARAELEAVQEACRLAGVDLKTPRELPAESRRRLSEAARLRWANKTPEQRAAWAAAIGRRKMIGNKNAAVQ